MSISSKRVIDWRKRTKEHLVKAMGGECVICGYNKCNAALAFHHLDPSKKDFTFSRVRANPKSIEKIIDEIKKCVMLCHNCHYEVHAGVTQVPKNAKSFDIEMYEEVVNLFKPKKLVKFCSVCDKEISHLNDKTCSNICSGKLKRKIDWDNIDFENEIKTKSNVQLAKELGCSEAIIRRRKKMIKGSFEN